MNTINKILKLLDSKEQGYIKLKRKKETINFEYFDKNAKEVYLTGNFISWSEKKLPMKKDKNGNWNIQINLPSGRYEYKYVVDGNWKSDPKNELMITNEYGTNNSIKKIVL